MYLPAVSVAFFRLWVGVVRYIQVALDCGLNVIACCGESLEIREANKTLEVSICRSPRWRIRLSSSLVWVSFVGSTSPECILV